MQIGTNFLKDILHYASTFLKQLSSSVAVILLLGIYLKEIIRNSVKHLCPQEMEIYGQSRVLKAYLWWRKKLENTLGVQPKGPHK